MKSIFINHSLDEFLACVYFLTLDERLSITDVYYATLDESSIKSLVPFIFPNIKTQSTLVSKLNIKGKIDRHSLNITMLNLLNVDVETLQHEALGFTRMFNRFKFPKVADVKIPHYKYTIITSEKLSDQGEIHCIEYLKSTGNTGIVVNDYNFFKCHHESIIDYTAQFTLLQKIELLKSASSFYGDSSAISIIAAKYFNNASFHVAHCDAIKIQAPTFYFAPKEWPILHDVVEDKVEITNPQIPRIF